MVPYLGFFLISDKQNCQDEHNPLCDEIHKGKYEDLKENIIESFTIIISLNLQSDLNKLHIL